MSNRGSRAGRDLLADTTVARTGDALVVDAFAPVRMFSHLLGEYFGRDFHFAVESTTDVLVVDLIAPGRVVGVVELLLGRCRRRVLATREHNEHDHENREKQRHRQFPHFVWPSF